MLKCTCTMGDPMEIKVRIPKLGKVVRLEVKPEHSLDSTTVEWVFPPPLPVMVSL